MRCLITTAPSGSLEEARELAGRFGLEAQPRAERPVPELVEASAGAPVLILSKARAELVHRGRAFRASVGMGFLRLVRARRIRWSARRSYIPAMRCSTLRSASPPTR